jgi:GPI mannosyltransferase 3
VHMAVPHKEYRFIYPAVVLLMVLAGCGLGQLAEWGSRVAMQRGLPPVTARASIALLVLAAWGTIAFGTWNNGLSKLRQRDHDELVAIAFVRSLPAVCGIGLFGEEAWVRYGGYTHLHRPIPLFWPKDDAALIAGAAGFDTLVTDAPPPASLGFQTERCFGEICVARRPGACEPRSTPGVWLPEQLRGKLSTEPRFPALPSDFRRNNTPPGPR